MAAAVEHAHLCALLEAFLLTDNNIRRQAEEGFNSLKETNPSGLLLGLIRELRENPETHVRQQASVSIRSLVLPDTTDGCWEKATADTRRTVQTQLLQALDVEPSKAVRRSLCDAVVSIAVKHNVDWPGLHTQLAALTESSKPASQAAGLKILADIYPQLDKESAGQFGGFQRLILTYAKSPDPKVRLECLGLVMALVQCERRSVWKHFQDSLPDFITGVSALVANGQYGLATEFLVKFVEVADTVAAFFKPHLHQLFQMLLTVGQNTEAEDETRQMAMEVLVGLAESQPQMCLKLTNFVTEVIGLCMKFMLTVEEDGEWIDNEDLGQDDETTMRTYDVGEAALDRIAAALGGENVMSVVLGYVSQYIQRQEWQYKLVGIMAISQTAEYLPEEDIEAHMEGIVATLMGKLKDPHHRVRFAACQAIGQISLDLQPMFQKTYSHVVLQELLAALDDTSTRVQAHAVAALVNFAEEVDKADLLPFADMLMNKLFERIAPQCPRNLREQCVTCIAVVAGVLEDAFLKYYPVVVPTVKDMLQNATSQEERSLRGRAAECASIIGLAVGPKVFEKDAHDIMHILLQIVAAGLESDDRIRDYIQETFCRICRTLCGGFLMYLPHLVPGILKALHVKPALMSADDGTEPQDMSVFSVADSGMSGLKTSLIEEIIQALELLSTFVEIMGPKFGDYLIPAADSVLPLLNFRFNDDVKRSALSAMAEILKATRELNESGAAVSATREAITQWLSRVLETVFEHLSDSDEVPDLELMVAETGGLAKCLRNAGPNVLSAQQINAVCEKVFELMQESSNRRAVLAANKLTPGFDEDELEEFEEEESSEQTLRSTLLEIVAALMSLYPALFLQTGALLSQKFIETYLHPNCSADDRALALYVSDDILEHLGNMGAPLWPSFASRLVDSLLDENPAVRQAAAFGMIQAAKCSDFPSELIQRAATTLAAVLRDPKSREKSQLSATDNAIAALGSIVLHSGKNLQPSPQDFLRLWINNLPLKVDDEEGRRVHADLVKLLVEQNPTVLGPNNSNLPKLAAVCAEIYRTEFSSTDIDKGIRQFAQATGFDVIQSIGVNFDQKLQKGLERIHRDVVAAED